MFTIEDGLLYCAVDFEKGRIVSLKKGKVELLGNTLLPLFEVAFRDPTGEQIRTTAFSASKVTVEQDQYSAVAVYSDLSVEHVSVTVKLSYDADCKELRWNIGVDNQSDYTLEWIDYPCVNLIHCLKDNGGDGAILWPYNEGAYIDDLTVRESCWLRFKEPSYPSKGAYGIYPAMVQSQFISLLTDGGGLYIGAHDKANGLKAIDFYRQENGIRFLMRIYAAVPPHTSYRMDYDVVYKVFEGDWYSAAEIYRNWFENNKNEKFIPIEQNRNLPDWYGESPIILTYPVRGIHDMDEMKPNRLFPYINAMPIVEKFSRDTDSKIMALLMHWEGTAPWAPPYVWPPYGGEEEFFKFRDALHASGNLMGVYCSGLGYTLQSNLIAEYNCSRQIEDENLKSIMCAGPDQVVALSNICCSQRSGYDMCPACEKTKQIIKAEVKKMCDGGLDYAQVLDQNHGGVAYFCYSKDHGHPASPGQWTVDEEIKLLENIQSEDKKFLFGCESAAAEPFIPQLLMSDNRFELNYKLGMPVPLYSYIYHRYVNNFMGNQVALDFKLSKDDFLYRLAYSFVAGDLSTVVLTDTGEIAHHWGCRDFSVHPDYHSVVTFLKNTNGMRKGIGKPYLYNGQMTRPSPVICAEENNRYPMIGRYDVSVPVLLTGCFQANDGTRGQVVVNYNDRDIEFSLGVDQGKECVMYHDPSGKNGVRYNGQTVTVRAFDVLLFVFK